MRDHRAFLGEAFDVLRLLLQVAQRNEEREIGVLVSGGLEHGVERALHVFPHAVAPRLDHHAAAHLGILRQIGGAHDLLIPFGKIFVAARGDGGFWVVGLGHNEARYLNRSAEVDQPRFWSIVGWREPERFISWRNPPQCRGVDTRQAAANFPALLTRAFR